MSSKASQPAPASSASSFMPLGAIAAGVGLSLLGSAAIAQQAPEAGQTLPAITVKGQADKTPEAKQGYQATTTNIGKGKQALRDIPQSITVHTERLMDDRNLDDFRDVLRTTAGVTFQAGETGEEDVRLRGFSLSQAGDIYVDGIKDPSLYERDTFNNDRVEVLKGSASMLFGKGSTGGIVNQVSKQPFLMTQHEAELMLGSGKERRLTGDFNIKTGESSALRINALIHGADNYGATIEKRGIAPTFRWGIGTADEFSVGYYHLEFDNRPLYNHPWFLSESTEGKIEPKLPAKNYYGLDSDYNKGLASYGTLGHIHRFQGGGELKTTVRHGQYERELWASVIRFAPGTTPENFGADTELTRAGKGRVGLTEITFVQSDYTNSFNWGGKKHSIVAGIDLINERARRNNNFAGPSRTGIEPLPTVGNPDNGASMPDTRGEPPFNRFNARTVGVYAQDMIEITPAIKLVGGLRHDQFKASYDLATGVDFSRSDSLWSKRIGALYQPNDKASFHVSYGTSFNTSGDTYQFTPGAPQEKAANTPPEKSRNFEIGGKFDLFDNALNLGVALFHTQKYHERNTDPDTAAQQDLLSGKRHAMGIDLDIAGRITPSWEAFVSYTWIPEAKIDESNVALASNGRGAQVEGDRPGLTPKHSASLWTTYRLTPQWRLGGGLNHRGEQNPEGARHVTAKAFTTLDLMAEYTVNTNYSVRLNVTNATDELCADSLYRGFYAPGQARAVQLTLKALF